MGKWILAFLIAAAVLFLCWKLRGVMLTPVCRGKGQSLEFIFCVSGASPELEATVDGLLWLINDGVLFWKDRAAGRRHGRGNKRNRPAFIAGTGECNTMDEANELRGSLQTHRNRKKRDLPE